MFTEEGCLFRKSLKLSKDPSIKHKKVFLWPELEKSEKSQGSEDNFGMQNTLAAAGKKNLREKVKNIQKIFFAYIGKDKYMGWLPLLMKFIWYPRDTTSQIVLHTFCC